MGKGRAEEKAEHSSKRRGTRYLKTFYSLGATRLAKKNTLLFQAKAVAMLAASPHASLKRDYNYQHYFEEVNRKHTLEAKHVCVGILLKHPVGVPTKIIWCRWQRESKLCDRRSRAPALQREPGLAFSFTPQVRQTPSLQNPYFGCGLLIARRQQHRPMQRNLLR